MGAEMSLKSAAIAACFSLAMSAGPVAAQVDNPSYDQGLERMGHRDFDGAILSFNSCVGSNSRNAKAYFKRGQCFYYLQSFKTAIEDFGYAINCEPKNSEYYLWRGATYCKTGDNAHSIRDYEEALRLDPGLLKAALSKEATEQDQSGLKSPMFAHKERQVPGKNALNEQSIHNYMEAARIVSNNLYPTFAGGTIFGGIIRPEFPGDLQTPYLRPENLDNILSDPKAVMESARRELDKVPTDAVNLFRRGLAFQQLGKIQRALDDFSEAINQQPNNTQYLLARAYANHLNKNDAAANNDIQKAQSVDPSLPAEIKFPAK